MQVLGQWMHTDYSRQYLVVCNFLACRTSTNCALALTDFSFFATVGRLTAVASDSEQRCAWEWDSQWDRESHGNPIGMGIKHRNGNGSGREWETTSVGMGITCTPMGIYSQRFYAEMSLSYISTILARCQCLLCRVCRLPKLFSQLVTVLVCSLQQWRQRRISSNWLSK